jgi:hypothetical protein
MLTNTVASSKKLSFVGREKNATPLPKSESGNGEGLDDVDI